MYISRTIQIDHTIEDRHDLNAFNEYIQSLVTTINHTPYNVSVEQTYDVDEEGEL